MPTFDDPYVEKIYQQGLQQIARVRARLRYDEDGVLILPTVCGSCEKEVIELEIFSNGDGLPICKGCIDGCVAAMSGAVEK